MRVTATIKSDRTSKIIPHLCGIPKRIRDKRVVVALRAFFDESAISPQDGPFLIMGGFVGSVAAFENAADTWQECLDESPAIEAFHHKDGSSEAKLIPLARSVAKHDLQGFVITIPHGPFRNREGNLTKGRIGTRVYDWGFIHSVKNVLQWVDERFPEDEKVDFIFHERRELKACRVLFDYLREEGRGFWSRAGTCTPESDNRVAALQMGDLLAGESLESMRTGRFTDAIRELAKGHPILLFRENPHPVIGKMLTLQSIGKKLFDDGRRKILDSPNGYVDPAVYEGEYRAIMTIGTIAKAANEMLRKESELLDSDEDASEES